MGRKRKAVGRSSAQSVPKDVDPADARLGPITTFEDIADSEDEFWMKRDVIEFDDEPSTKRRKRWDQEEKALEESEEEILDYDDDDDDDDDEELELERLQANLKTKSKKGRSLDSDEEAPGDDDEDEDEGWRGANRDEYYNADNIETEEAALEEEAEALRLQQKKLAKMSEADFIFDQDEWAAAAAEDDDKDKLATEVLKDVEISENLSAEERYQIFQRRYPEFDYLVNEFEQLQPLLAGLQKEAEGKPAKSLEVLKYWILGCYVAALASYFAILTSPARDDNGAERTLEPDELRDHEVMETLVSCRKQWVRVRNLRSSAKSTEAANDSPVPEELPPQPQQSAAGEIVPVADKKPARKLSRKERAQLAKREALALEKAAAQAKRDAAVEASLADLSSLLNKTKTKPKKTTKKVAATSSPTSDTDSLSDFGEETTLSSRAAAEKAARKKSLRFYTSQITQKASKRSTNSRDAGGDIDIPYRERLRDRQARLSAAAAKRGSAAGPGADLGEDSGSEYDDADRAAARAVRDGHGSDDEYYDMVAASSKQKKDERAAKYVALAAANTADLVVPQETVGEDGKRKITYAIQKNKGLTPHRKKENRNPRVKKRRAFAEKQKKWKTMRPTYSGGEGKGGYQGELTGIKKGLVKVTRL